MNEAPLTPILDAAPTFRDLGGVATMDGRRVRRGQLFRAGILVHPSPAASAAVRSLGLRWVMDLRSDHERNHSPGTWADYGATRTLNSDVSTDVRAGNAALMHLLESDFSVAGAQRMMVATYEHLPQGFRQQLPRLFDLLLDETGLPLMVHCTAGKDRTGFACALVLHALGAAEESIFEEYLKSGDLLVGTPVSASMGRLLEKSLGRPPEPEALAVIMGVRREFLETALTAVRIEYGSVDNYLEQVGGLTTERRARLRQRLLE
ncbi:tyrosine-protein phosphatase [Denitratisoma oestradiolicum]|uniref:Protein tyrosine/serine phosphatase n=1 Tax=Denitratisoma oestradiolicum TaxID=311182 RepID=A0A6S6XNR5_9PROT|nr:tyrosine-protein phosphatase [Denitratisoma oestradiolicum]TWO80513.1 hypothetical protein CBW56_08715 [Denitratisoma oestradiolicum]CAB1367581.1 Protein tyrosine/serine phosphatase [Denitratisoma oestradiolicum]